MVHGEDFVSSLHFGYLHRRSIELIMVTRVSSYALLGFFPCTVVSLLCLLDTKSFLFYVPHMNACSWKWSFFWVLVPLQMLGKNSFLLTDYRWRSLVILWSHFLFTLGLVFSSFSCLQLFCQIWNIHRLIGSSLNSFHVDLNCRYRQILSTYEDMTLV